MTTTRHVRSIWNDLRPILILVLTASFGALACQLPTLLQLDSPSTNQPAVADVDPDQDGVPSSRDNCPLSSNPDQAEGETSLIGTSCENLLPNGMAIPFRHGVVQVQLDSGGRPTRIGAPSATVGIGWAQGPGTLALTVEAEGGIHTFDLQGDFADAAILEAAQTVEASSDSDTSFMRSWVAGHPRWVLDIASGRMAPLLSPQSSNGLPGEDVELVSSRIQQGREDVELYIGELTVIAAVAMANYHDYSIQHPELDPSVSAVRNHLMDVAVAVSHAATEEIARCEPWTLSCHYKGTPGTCDLPSLGRQVCVESGDLECIALGGRFNPGGSCPGACWAATENLPPQCAPTNKRICEALPSRSNIPGSGFYVTAVFCPDRGCSDPLCRPDVFPGRAP